MQPIKQKSPNDAFILKTLAECPDWLDVRVKSRLSGYPDPDSCWTWLGHCHWRGHGTVMLPRSVKRAHVLTHRVIWLAIRGPIPEGYVIDHDGEGCGNKACANPDHLSAVPEYVNVAITGSSLPALNSRKTHCIKGHPLTAENLRLRARGRQCLACDREYAQEGYRLQREAARILGLSVNQYRITHGQSQKTARRIIEQAAA